MARACQSDVGSSCHRPASAKITSSASNPRRRTPASVAASSSPPRRDRRRAADRLPIREVFDAYARCADRRDAAGQKALFAENCTFAVHMDGEATEATYVLHGREALTPVFEGLNEYD